MAINAGTGDPDVLVLRSVRGRVALAAAVAGSAMASLDATIVNVALPHIGHDLHADVASLQWVLTGYLLALASLILLSGALGDRFGRRRIFVIGTIWFAAASLLCGVAPNIEVLVAARLLQGIGGALLTPGSLAILQASFREDDRAAAVGAWSGLGGAAGALGPVVGGTLVDGPGWRWAFLLNLPVAAVAVVCARSAVPETRDHHAGERRLDLVGAALAVVGLAAGTWTLTEAGPKGWGATEVLFAGALGIAAIAAFVWHVLHTGDPLVPPALFANRTFTVVNLATVPLYGALGVAFFLVAYELQVAAGWTALEAGLALLPVTILMLLFSAMSGSIAQKIGPRIQLTVGPLLAGIGLLLLTRIGTDASWVSDVLPGALVFGLGLVVFVAPLTATVMAAADADHVSVASGVNNAVARTASLAAVALVPAISGLSVASGAVEVTNAFHLGMVVTAIAAVVAAPVAFFGLKPRAKVAHTDRRVHCSLDGTPFELGGDRLNS
jgi:EmrB/QacA subfamily drug resistance transporter